MYNTSVEHIKAHIKRTLSKAKDTERGELMTYFCQRLNVQRPAGQLPQDNYGPDGENARKDPDKGTCITSSAFVMIPRIFLRNSGGK